MQRVCVIGFSYGIIAEEPNEVNRSLAHQMDSIGRDLAEAGYEVFKAAQWEIALALDWYDWCVRPQSDPYLGSKDVIDDITANLLEPKLITMVVPVCQPFLQLHAVQSRLSSTGYDVLSRPVKRVGHVADSLQSRTRNAPALALYTLLHKLFGYQDQPIITPQMRRLIQDNEPPRTKP